MVLHSLAAAYKSWAFLGLRTALAAVFLYHGIPKLKDPAGMAEAMGMPTMGPLLIGFVEVFGSLAVLLGVYARWGALSLSILMGGALYMKIVEWEAPFSAKDQTGWEFDLVLFAASLLLVTAGAGSLVIL